MTQVASGSDNTAIGYEVLKNADGADFCTAVGHRCAMAITDGQYNTAMGVGALLAETGGDYNTAIGSGSLRYCNNATGHNTAVGHNALHNVTTGYSNVAIGVDTGDTITTGEDNTYLGRHADASGGGVTITSNGTGGTYTKIGRFVMCTGRLTMATSGSNTLFQMDGLHFTPASLGNSAQGGVIPEHTKSSNDNPPFFMAVEASSNTIRIRNRNSGALTISQCSGQSFRFILSYFAS